MTQGKDNIGLRIRGFFRGLFGSQVVEVLKDQISRLEASQASERASYDTVLADVRRERDVLRSEVARLNLALMPLSSAAGANYVRQNLAGASNHPLAPIVKKLAENPFTGPSFEQIEAAHEEELAKLEAADALRDKAAKESQASQPKQASQVN